jgi:hypothetical protein
VVKGREAYFFNLCRYRHMKDGASPGDLTFDGAQGIGIVSGLVRRCWYPSTVLRDASEAMPGTRNKPDRLGLTQAPLSPRAGEDRSVGPRWASTCPADFLSEKLQIQVRARRTFPAADPVGSAMIVTSALGRDHGSANFTL